ncbi:hypothetical protein [Alloalcanivorax xenomutans]|uniref:hypothetical protein n=1 Tax=Alloalcanivorax xenomutans TaxID=1094342 RepID=UPI000479B41A
MQKRVLVPLIALPLFSPSALAGDLYPLGKAEGTTWKTVAQAEKDNRLSVAALSTDGEMQMVFTFETIIGSTEQFLGVFDAPAASCGQSDGKTMTLSAPDPSRLMQVNGQEFPSSENCLEGHTHYSFKGVDAAHDISASLIAGKPVTLSIPRDDGRKEYTWEPDGFKALARERVKEYEEGSRYQAYKGMTR